MAQYLPDPDEVGMGYGSLAPGAAPAPLRSPANDFGFQGPIMNGTPPPNPMAHVGELIADHANIIRQRLFAAHAREGLAPEQVSEHGQVRPNPLALISQTRNPAYSHLAALLAKFQGQGMTRPNFRLDPPTGPPIIERMRRF